MVDEYQDSNEVQERIFAALSLAGQNRFMVGDVKQSIYRFRLADPSIFLEKYRTYVPAATAEAGQPRKILLSENFRSRPEILAAVNDVFSAVMSEQVGDLTYGEAEALRPGLDFPAGTGPGGGAALHGAARGGGRKRRDRSRVCGGTYFGTAEAWHSG